MPASADQHHLFYERGILMEGLFSDILSVIGGAMVCGVILSLVPKGPFEALLKMICGLFLTLCLLYPLIHFPYPTIPDDWLSEEGFSPEEASSLGEEFARRELCQCIKREAEEYILDKAAAMNVLLSADVSLSDSEIPVPAAVTVYTSADPSTREVLSQFLSEDLGISKENQLWMEMSSVKK